MAIGYASVRVNITSFVVDGIDSDDLPDDAPLTAKLMLTPMIQPGRTLQFNDAGQMKLKAVAPIVVDIGATGDISHQGRDFVKVVAPTAVETNLARLQWRADFSDIRLGGALAAVKIDPIYFWVDPGAEINIADHVNVAASTAVSISRGARGFGIVGFETVDGDLVPLYESADGVIAGEPVSLAGVVSDGVLASVVADDESETKGILDTAYAPKEGTARAWQASTSYAADTPAILPNGKPAIRTAAGTSRSTFDPTEEALWTITGGTTTVDGLTDATSVGKAVAKASTQAAARTAISAASVADIAAAGTPRRYSRPQFRVIPGSNWSFPSGLDAGATINTSYADVNPLGTTATRVLTAGAGSPVIRQTFTAPVDMTGKQWIIWVKIPDMAQSRNLVLYAYDSNLSSSAMWTFPVYGPVGTLNSPKYLVHPDVWTPIVVPWDPTTTTGTPNRAAVNRVHIGISDNATGVPTDFRFAARVGMVDQPAAFTNGAVSITIDDSVSLDVIKPKLTQYGYPCTLFPIGESFGVGGRPTTAEVRTLIDNLGWEVAAHAASSDDHVSVEELSQADRLANFGRVKQWHTANGFPTDIYGWPNGTSSEAAFADLRGIYSVARGVGTGWMESLPPARPEYLRTVVVSAGTGTTLAQITALIDRAYSANAWLILCFHAVVASGATGQATNKDIFDGIVDYIAGKSGMKCMTVGDVMRLV